MKIFGYEIGEIRKALIAGLYVVFAVVMLVGFAPKVGFENAVFAVVGPLFGVFAVFEAKNHTPDEVQKALEALKSAVFSAISYYVVIPGHIGQAVTMLIGGLVMWLAVKYVPNAGRGAPGHGSTVAARGP
jgi:predicted small integral membrane protein